MTRLIAALPVLLLLLLCIPPALGIPNAVSYADDVTLVHDQDHRGGCQGYSALHVLEIMKERELAYSPDPSYGFLMYVFQAARNTTHPDPRVAHNPDEGWESILTTYGLPPETSYPTNFDILGSDVANTTLLHPPSDEAFEQARGSRAIADSSTTVIYRPTVLQAEEMIDGYGPVVCDSLFLALHNVSDPNDDETHTVALIGYNRTLREFTIVDSANWLGIPHADVKQVSYATFEAARDRIALRSVRNTASSYQPPYTARIRVGHADRRSFLTVKIGAEGHEPVTVWDRNNHVNYTDLGHDLEIDVPLPAYAAEHWPPSDQNLWYVEVTNHDSDHAAELREVTLVQRQVNTPPLPNAVYTHRQPGVPMAIGPGGTGRLQFPRSLTITSPNGGESWTGGERQTIRFGQVGLSGTNVRLDLLRGTAPVAEISSSWPAGSGSIDWYVPTTLPHASDYYVRVQSLADSRISDRSDARLTIAPTWANFTANPVSGPSPLTVRFTDTSSGEPAAWLWNFGDGQTSTTRHPSHSYSGAGTYTVTLTVTYPGGETRTVMRSNLVTVYEPLRAMFEVNSRVGYEPFTVTFHDLSTGMPEVWHWDFGDGATSNLQNPTHTYQGGLSGDAFYTVVLTVSNSYDTKTATMTDFIRVIPLYGGRIRVEAEDYIDGGEGVAYHDTTPGNSGGGYRSDDVDIVGSGTGGWSVTEIAETEWTKYWVWSPATDTAYFPVTIRVAALPYQQTIDLSADGDALVTNEDVPSTGSLSTYTDLETSVRLRPGANLVKVACHGGHLNLDYFTLDPSAVLPMHPDLRSSELYAWTASPIVNRTFALQNAVVNGGFAAGPFTVGFYLSSDSTFTTSDILIGTRTISGLASGAVTPRTNTTVTIPASVPAGTYYLGMIADSTNAVTESDETNNVRGTMPSQFMLAASPDLVVDAFQTPAGPITNRTFTIRNGVRNIGDAAAVAYTVEFYLSTDSSITPSDTLIGTRSAVGLPAGWPELWPRTLMTIPASVPSGSYYLGMIIDTRNNVTEGNELNNIATSTGPIRLDPLLAVLAVPPGTALPTDTNGDGVYDDVNGNGRKDFADVVLYFNQMGWIAANEPVAAFDCNANGRIDFADVVWLFTHL